MARGTANASRATVVTTTVKDLETMTDDAYRDGMYRGEMEMLGELWRFAKRHKGDSKHDAEFYGFVQSFIQTISCERRQRLLGSRPRSPAQQRASSALREAEKRKTTPPGGS